MHESNRTLPAWTVGLDVSDRHTQVYVVDAAGQRVEETRIRTTPTAVRQWCTGQPRMRVVLEVGTHSPWLSRVVAACGHEVLVANARKLRLIYQNDRKSDRLDAASLARLGRLDPTLLAPIHHRGAVAQADLALLRARDTLVRARAQLVNHVRGAVKAVGGRLPACSTPSFAQRVAAELPEVLRPALEPLLATLKQLNAQIRHYDRTLERVAQERYPETARLRQVRGVGPLTALCYVLTLEDPQRFRRSRAVAAYLGLCPRQWDSGERQAQLRITKAGDAMARRLLISAAQYILGPFGPDTALRSWGLGLVARGGRFPKQRAVVAVARKLAGLLHSLWVHERDYVPGGLPGRVPQAAWSPVALTKRGGGRPVATVAEPDVPSR
jgi:transposase